MMRNFKQSIHLALVLTVAACGSGPQTPSTIGTTQSENPPATASVTQTTSAAKISLSVKQLDGSALAGVTIRNTASGTTVVSDSSGVATIDTANTGVLNLELSKAGFANQFKAVAMDGTALNIPIAMAERAPALKIADATVGGLVGGRDGISANFGATSLVGASSTPIAGEVQMTITPFNLTSDAKALPGVAPTAIPETSSTFDEIAEFVPMQNGQKLQVANGKKVTIEVPIYQPKTKQGILKKVGDTGLLLSMDKTSGQWVIEGEALVVANTASPTGLAVRASVAHFSYFGVILCNANTVALTGGCSLPQTPKGTGTITFSIEKDGVGKNTELGYNWARNDRLLVVLKVFNVILQSDDSIQFDVDPKTVVDGYSTIGSARINTPPYPVADPDQCAMVVMNVTYSARPPNWFTLYIERKNDAKGNKIFAEDGISLSRAALSAAKPAGTIYNGPKKCRSFDDIGFLMRRDNIIRVEENYNQLFFPNQILYSSLGSNGIDGGLNYDDADVMSLRGFPAPNALKLPFKQTIKRGPFTWVIDLN
jgi:hypothetical protein